MPGPRGPRHAPLAPLLVVLLVATLFAGCTDADPDDGTPTTTDPTGTTSPTPSGDRDDTSPYTLHFDGARAYQDALAQMYEEPATHSGPRYRIPGTDTHAEVAVELKDKLDVPMRALGGLASLQRFDGDRYYDLDLGPVDNYLCARDNPARDRVRDLEFVNIVGRSSPDEVGLIIGAHWDTKRHADPNRDPDNAGEPILGGDDGASGTAAVIELARAFAAEEPGIALTFILFDGEDGFEPDDCHPLAGSLYYAQTLSEAERETVKGMVLLDMIGNETAEFWREGHSQSYTGSAGRIESKWLQDAVWSTAEQIGNDDFLDTSPRFIADDHLSFLNEGIPSLDIIRYEGTFAPYWHTTKDDHTAISAAGIDRSGDVVEASVRRLAEELWSDPQQTATA